MPERTWTITEARTKLRELIALARARGPQTITRYGKATGILMAAEEKKPTPKRKGSLAEFFAASPLRNSGLVIER
jgi:prevent-host-death family protein